MQQITGLFIEAGQKSTSRKVKLTHPKFHYIVPEARGQEHGTGETTAIDDWDRITIYAKLSAGWSM